MSTSEVDACHTGGAAPVHGEQPTAAGGGQGEELRKWQILIYGSWCKRCGVCIEFCPRGVYDEDAQGTPLPARVHQCNGCQLCALHCPDFAVTVDRVSTASPSEC